VVRPPAASGIAGQRRSLSRPPPVCCANGGRTPACRGERPVAAPDGFWLRCRTFYGPAASAPIEITDAAAATLAPVGRGSPGVHDVIDDALAPVAESLRY
jgi:hypothetical protein